MPAGTSMRPGELGCFMTRMRINKTTKLGKRSRNPRGMDIEDLPLSLIRLRKKDNRGRVLGFSFFHSSGDGAGETEGRRLSTRCTNPMVVVLPPGGQSEAGLFALLLQVVMRRASTRHRKRNSFWRTQDRGLISRGRFGPRAGVG